jgi:hypothetical protein
MRQRPAPTESLAQLVNRSLDVPVRYAPVEHLVDDDRFGDVLEAVEPRTPFRLGRADVATPRPLTDRRAGHAGEAADLGREVYAARRQLSNLPPPPVARAPHADP